MCLCVYTCISSLGRGGVGCGGGWARGYFKTISDGTRMPVCGTSRAHCEWCLPSKRLGGFGIASVALSSCWRCYSRDVNASQKLLSSARMRGPSWMQSEFSDLPITASPVQPTLFKPCKLLMMLAWAGRPRGICGSSSVVPCTRPFTTQGRALRWAGEEHQLGTWSIGLGSPSA